MKTSTQIVIPREEINSRSERITSIVTEKNKIIQ